MEKRESTTETYGITTEKTNQDNKASSNYRRIEGTPFALVKKDELYHIAFGDYLITLGSTTEEDAESLIPLNIEENKWHTLIALFNALIVTYHRFMADQAKSINNQQNQEQE